MNPIYSIPTTDPRVQAAADWIKAQLTPIEPVPEVTMFDGITEGPYALEVHLVTFGRNGKTYTAQAGLLALYPSITATELKAMAF